MGWGSEGTPGLAAVEGEQGNKFITSLFHCSYGEKLRHPLNIYIYIYIYNSGVSKVFSKHHFYIVLVISTIHFPLKRYAHTGRNQSAVVYSPSLQLKVYGEEKPRGPGGSPLHCRSRSHTGV